MSLQFDLPAPGRLRPNDHKDPLPYYYRPLTGWLYRHRLQMGRSRPGAGRRKGTGTVRVLARPGWTI